MELYDNLSQWHDDVSGAGQSIRRWRRRRRQMCEFDGVPDTESRERQSSGRVHKDERSRCCDEHFCGLVSESAFVGLEECKNAVAVKKQLLWLCWTGIACVCGDVSKGERNAARV